jgi:hypothetical protein
LELVGVLEDAGVAAVEVLAVLLELPQAATATAATLNTNAIWHLCDVLISLSCPVGDVSSGADIATTPFSAELAQANDSRPSPARPSLRLPATTTTSNWTRTPFCDVGRSLPLRHGALLCHERDRGPAARCAGVASLLSFVHRRSDEGVDAGGCSATRATGRCASASLDQARVIDALRLGATAFIVKPLDPETVLDAAQTAPATAAQPMRARRPG